MRRVWLGVLIVGGALAPGASANAEVIRVSHGGTDGATCGIGANPDCADVVYAVNDRAQDGDTIAIVPSPTPWTFGQLSTTKNVSITKAPGDGEVIFAGNGQGAQRTLSLTVDAPVTLRGLTFRSAVARTVPELVTSGPVTGENLVFDSEHDISAGARVVMEPTSDGVPSLIDSLIAGAQTSNGSQLEISGTSGDNQAALTDVTLDGSGADNNKEAIRLDHVDVSGFTTTAVGSTVALMVNGRTTIADATFRGVSNAALSVRKGSLNGDANPPATELDLRGSSIDGGALPSLAVFDDSILRTDGNVVFGASDVAMALSTTGQATSTHDTILGRVTTNGQPDLSLNRTYVERLDFDPIAGACVSASSITSEIVSGGDSCGLTVLAGDPGFVNAVTGDAHLLATSPLIDAGIENDAFDLELDGGLRTLDGNADGVAKSDVGADEFAPSPDTVINTGPGATLAGQAATFTFSSSTAGVTFTCQLDGGPATPCDAGTFTSGALGAGSHTFSVAATLAGLTDATPATSTFILTDPATPGGGTPGGGTPGTGTGGTPGGGPATGSPVRKVTISRPRLSRSRITRRTLLRTVRARAVVSGRATVKAALEKLVGKTRTRRVGKIRTIRVTRPGTLRITLSSFARRVPPGRYRVRLQVGSTTVRSAVLVVRR